MALGITGVTPATGPTTGQNQVFVTGSDLDTVTTVTVGGSPAVTFAALSKTLMRVTMPAHAAGAAVSIVVGDGTTTQTLAAAYTFAEPTGDEQLVSTLARKFRVEVDTSPDASGTWIPVRAIGELKPNVDTTLEDDSDYDSDGWQSQAKTGMAWTLETKLVRKAGLTSGNYDPGQEVLRAAANSFGAAGTVHVRWFDRQGGPEAYEGFATVSWAPDGGGSTALDTVTVTLTGQGRRNDIANPAA